MPNPPWPKKTIFNLEILGSCLGSLIVTTHHFEAAAVVDTPGLADDAMYAASVDLAGDWITAAKTAYLATRPNEYTMNLLRCQVVERPGQWKHRLTPYELAITSTNTGTSATQADTLADSAVIKWRSTLAGKRHRGRTFLGPLGVTWMVDGRLTATATTAITAYCNIMKAQWAVGGADVLNRILTVYSRPYNYKEYGYVTGSGPNREMYWPPEYAGDSTNVTDFSVDSIVRTQRRRVIGVGA